MRVGDSATVWRAWSVSYCLSGIVLNKEDAETKDQHVQTFADILAADLRDALREVLSEVKSVSLRGDIPSVLPSALSVNELLTSS